MFYYFIQIKIFSITKKTRVQHSYCILLFFSYIHTYISICLCPNPPLKLNCLIKDMIFCSIGLCPVSLEE